MPRATADSNSWTLYRRLSKEVPCRRSDQPIVGIYDKHFTDDEVKGLLQFYGSPLGRKYAAEMPKISSEIQAANHAVSTRVAKNVLQDLPRQYPGIGTPATSLKPQAVVQTKGTPGKPTRKRSYANPRRRQARLNPDRVGQAIQNVFRRVKPVLRLLPVAPSSARTGGPTWRR